ncbi:YoaK family protein [uncultured Sphingomonas sp.]|uniref:YoaK family protein n=1 Tax=uncultured Sphingomonas sp. TaxID=158754 RepID=UPI0025D46E26|nr:YoaK family protein [uncultured Sphingomonas sp.]
MTMMQTRPFPVLPVAAAIAALAGFVDAYAFIRLGNFFVSFMSGNATRGGVALGGGFGGGGGLAISLVLAFLAGVIMASIVSRRFERGAAPAVMGLTTLLIVGAALATMASSLLAMPLLAGAMGAMNGVLLREDGVAVGLTYMTGNLVKLGQGLADALMGEGPPWRWVPYLLLWLTFVGGAVGGAIVEQALGDFTLWYAALVAAWLALLLAGRARRRSAPRT